MSVYIKFIEKIDSDNVTDRWFMEQLTAKFFSHDYHKIKQCQE